MKWLNRMNELHSKDHLFAVLALKSPAEVAPNVVVDPWVVWKEYIPYPPEYDYLKSCGDCEAC